MISVNCPGCGAVVLTRGEPEVLDCRSCGARFETRPLLARQAIEGLREGLSNRRFLPDDLRAEIDRLLAARLEAMPPPAAPTAPLTPPLTPPPLPPSAFRGAAAPAPAAPAPPEPERPPPPPPGPPMAPRGPSVWARLGPAFTENILFALAVFLLVAGAVYFVTTAWTTMTGEQQLLVVVGGIEALGVVLFGAGRLLNRRGNLPEVERVLLVVTGFLVPVAAAAAGELISESLPLGLAAAVAVLVPGFFAARLLARLADTGFARTLPLALVAVSAAILPAHAFGRSPAAAGAAGGAVTLLALAFHVRRGIPANPARLGPAVWSGLLLAFAGAVLAAVVCLAASWAELPPGRVFGPLGIAAAAAGAGAALLAGRAGEGRSTTLCAAALALSAAGAVIALGDERALLAAAAIGAAASLAAGLRLPVPALLLPGLVLSAVAYLHLPAPVRAIATVIRDRAAGALGYAPRALPLAYYGLTFLPFVLACGLFATRLGRSSRAGHAHVALVFTAAASAGLCLLSLAACRGDLRAPAAVLAAEGALLIALAVPARNRWFVLAGALLSFGGLSCGLHHLEAETGFHLLAMSAAGLAAVAVAARLRPRGGFAAGVSDSLFDAAAVMALAVVTVLAVGALPPPPGETRILGLDPAGAADLAGAPALALLLFVLAAAYRRPEPALAGVLLLARAAAGALAAAGLDDTGAWRPLAFSLAAALPLSALWFLPRATERWRRLGLRDANPALLVPAGMVVLVLIGAAAAAGAVDHGGLSWHHCAGLLAGAAVLAAAAARSGQSWVAAIAAGLFVAAGATAAPAFHRDFGAAESVFGAAVATALVRVAGRLSAARERLRAAFATAFDAVPTIVEGGILLPGFAFALAEPASLGPQYAIPASNGCFVAAAALVACAAARLAKNPIGAFFSGLLFGFVPLAICQATSAGDDLFVLGLAASAGAVVAAARGSRARVAAGVVIAALTILVAVPMAIDEPGRDIVFLATFLAAAAAGRAAARRLPHTGGVLFLFALDAMVSVVICYRMADMPSRWQPALLIAFAGLSLLAPRVRALAVTRRAAVVFALPFLGTAAVLLFVFAGYVALPGLPYDGSDPDPRGPLALAAVLLVPGVVLLAWRLRPLLRVLVPVAALALATFACAPVNILIAGDFARWHRPDVEVALAGLLMALLVPGERGRKAPAAYGFSALALLLTAGNFRDLSTPLTVAVAAGTALAMLFRDRRAMHADLHAYLLIAAAFAFVLWAVPESGRPATEVLCLLSLASAAMLLALLALSRAFRRRFDVGLSEPAAPCFTRAAATAGVLAIAMLLANVISLQHRRAETDLALLATAAMLVTAATSIALALRPGKERLFHAATAAVLALYAFLSARTGALEILAGYHSHALAAIGAGLLGATAVAGGRLRRPLAFDGLLLPIPAALWSLFYLATGIGPGGEAALGFFLAAAAYGIGAARFQSRPLGALTAILLNLALFALWRERGIVDPSFYGVPPGLTLLLTAEVLRGRVKREAYLAVFVAGAVLLYGSVGVQVLRVEEPAHALVLFGLGLLAVVAGFLRSRNEFLVAGTSVVVLDVIAYLARHGFAQGFLSAVLLVLAGLTVLTVGTLATLRRRRAEEGK